MLLVQNQSLTLSWGCGGASRRSDHVDLFKQVLLPVGLELLRPVHNGGFEEAAAAQVEKRDQVLHHTHTVNTAATQTRANYLKVATRNIYGKKRGLTYKSMLFKQFNSAYRVNKSFLFGFMSVSVLKQ